MLLHHRGKDGIAEEHLLYGAFYPVKPILDSTAPSASAGFNQLPSDANSTKKFSTGISVRRPVWINKDTGFSKTFGLPDEMQMPSSHLTCESSETKHAFEHLRICDHKPHTIALDPGILLFLGQVFNHTGPVHRISPMQTTAALPQAMLPCIQPDDVQCPAASV